MSRQRAQVFRGPGYRPSKRQDQRAERQRLQQQLKHPEPQKRTLSERVLPWRRLKARRAAASAEKARVAGLATVKRLQAQDAKVREFKGRHRRLCRGQLTIRDRMVLHEIGRVRRERGEVAAHDHPQLRRIERELRRGTLHVFLERNSHLREQFGALDDRPSIAA